jgi:hypothetical protein
MVVRCATPCRPPWYRRLLFLCLLGSACLFTWHKADPQVREIFSKTTFWIVFTPTCATPYRPPWYWRLLFLCLLGSACLFTWHKADPQVRVQRPHFDSSSLLLCHALPSSLVPEAPLSLPTRLCLPLHLAQGWPTGEGKLILKDDILTRLHSFSFVFSSAFLFTWYKADPQVRENLLPTTTFWLVFTPFHLCSPPLASSCVTRLTHRWEKWTTKADILFPPCLISRFSDHGLISCIDTTAKCRHLKNCPGKGLCGRCLSPPQGGEGNCKQGRHSVCSTFSPFEKCQGDELQVDLKSPPAVESSCMLRRPGEKPRFSYLAPLIYLCEKLYLRSCFPTSGFLKQFKSEETDLPDEI